MKSSIFRNMTLYSPLKDNRRFGHSITSAVKTSNPVSKVFLVVKTQLRRKLKKSNKSTYTYDPMLFH
jgi:hypothetical protein